MRDKRIFRLIIAALLFATCFLALSSCKSTAEVKVADLTLDELEECVTIREYKNVEIALDGKTKQEAIAKYIEDKSNVKSYPDGAVDYYFEQLKKQYHYYAEKADMKYEELLDTLGEDNVTMKAEARRLVKKDLVLELIRKKEGITLTDEEKSAFFDRYVKKYAESYNYDEKYVREELSELVYESMLYDKTLEFLIINNTFVEGGEAESEK